jgi:transcriptional regulator with XRE-family HTH domain
VRATVGHLALLCVPPPGCKNAHIRERYQQVSCSHSLSVIGGNVLKKHTCSHVNAPWVTAPLAARRIQILQRNSPCQTVLLWLLCRHPQSFFRMSSLMNIGDTIRNYRLQKGMSQGDIEKRTGLLRCYLSRVENGHTIPSLDTLAKIAGAMELPLSQFFADSGHSNGSKGLPQLSDDELRFLSQIRRYATNLNESDRKLVLAMVKKMAASSGK